MSNPAERIREAALPAYEPDKPQFREEALFNAISGILTDSSNMIIPEWAPFTVRAGKKTVAIHGYEYDEELEVLTLILLLDCHRNCDLSQPWDRQSCGSGEIKKAFADLIEVIVTAREEKLPKLDESDPANRFYSYLAEYAKGDAGRLSLSVWTTGELSREGWKKSDVTGYHTEVWDASRLATAMDCGHESLEVDFTQYGGGIDLLMEDTLFKDGGAEGGAVLIGKIPGDCLADIYFQHRTRILQQNVRAFLSFSGSVNKNILHTAKAEPGRFLAYNNGIATTSSGVKLEKRAPGVYRLTGAADFQIVNGGQTTATLMSAKNDRGVDLSAVKVPMKLTIVRLEDLDELVPKISRYANSQNKIQDSDFESNNPWLVKLETISRRVEAAKDSKSDGQRLRWYFERVRGQYNVDLGKEKTQARKNSFKAANPPRTKFSKTDLAVVAMAWDLEPYVSSWGPQKCFANFAKRLFAAREAMGKGSVCEPSEEDFRRLCGLMLLRREAMTLCREIGIDPRLSNSAVSAYAIARISHDMKRNLPWGTIWSQQQLPTAIEHALRVAIRGCESVILQEAPRKAKQPSEYAKKAECWLDVADAPMDLKLSIARMTGLDKFSIMDTVRPSELVEADGLFFSFDQQEWKLISRALKQITPNAAYFGCAETMGKNVGRRKKPTDKQARILAKAFVLLKSRGKCIDLLSKLPNTSWPLVEQIAASARS
jgi:hypothetical protein